MSWGIFQIFFEGHPEHIFSYTIENNTIHLILSDNKNGENGYFQDIIFNDKNSITITRGKKTQTYYIMDGHDKNFIQKAVTNTENVKIYVKPSDSSFSWGTFSVKSKLSIREKSDSKDTINGESYYRYRVLNPTLPDDWVFGKKRGTKII